MQSTRDVLIGGSERAPDLRRRGLGLVHRHCSAQGANTQSADETPDGELLPGVERQDLDEDADHEDAALHRHRIPTAEVVSGSAAQAHRASAIASMP